MAPNASNTKWHMDRGIPIAFIISMFGLFISQTAIASWFASKLDARVEVLESSRLTAAPQADRLTRVEVKVENIQLGITEIKDLIRTSGSRKEQN